MPPTTRPIQKELFWSRTIPEPNSGCHFWLGASNKRRYGFMCFDGRSQKAHRIAWLLTRGPIPQGLRVLHRCDMPECVNPDHLFLGTQADNVADMESKGRQVRANAQKTHCKRGHEFTPGNTWLEHNGWRHCRTCAQEREARRVRCK